MTSKIFAEKGRVRLVGDSRDIMLSSTTRQEVWDWCQDNDIKVEYQGTLSGIDLWRVVDEEQRIWFILKWL